MVTANSLIDRHSDRIEERISKTMVEYLASRCPWFRDKVRSSMDVVPASQIGRDLKIIKIFQNPVAGVMESDRGRDRFTLYGDGTTQVAPKFYTQAVTNVWPDGLDGPNPLPYRLAVSLHGFLTNLVLTMAEMDAEANPNFIGRILAPKMKAFANARAKQLEMYFILSQNNDYRLCVIDGLSAWDNTVTSYWVATFQPDNLATSRFNVGDRVDIYEADGGDRKNDSVSAAASQLVTTRLNLWVAAVDHMSNTVTLAADADPNGWTGNGGADPADGDFIVYANSKLGSSTIKGLAGLNSWLKFGSGGDDNFLMGAERDSTDAISVITHPEFKSYGKAVNGALTESKLQRYLAMALHALGVYGFDIDTLLCSFGVKQNYLEQKIGQYRIDRTRQKSSTAYEGDDGKLTITVNGKTLTFEESNCVESGTVYGVKMKGNWEMAVPPSGPGVQKDGDVPGWPFEFVAPALGFPSVKVPIFNSASTNTRLTSAVMMPGRLRLQWLPKQAAGLKLTGITESREYSDN